jgi:hypothetical protein
MPDTVAGQTGVWLSTTALIMGGAVFTLTMLAVAAATSLRSLATTCPRMPTGVLGVGLAGSNVGDEDASFATSGSL